GGGQETIPTIESDRVAKENQLRVLLGKTPGPSLRSIPMYDLPVVPTVPAGLPSTLLERRPDLRQAEDQLVSANARIGIAKAEFFRKFNITTLLGTTSAEVPATTDGSATRCTHARTVAAPIRTAASTLGTYRPPVPHR